MWNQIKMEKPRLRLLSGIGNRHTYSIQQCLNKFPPTLLFLFMLQLFTVTYYYVVPWWTPLYEDAHHPHISGKISSLTKIQNIHVDENAF